MKYPELEILSREKNMEFSEDRKVGNWQRKTRDMFSIPLRVLADVLRTKGLWFSLRRT